MKILFVATKKKQHESDSELSWSVTTQNTPPGAPEIYVDPARFESGEDLWCGVDLDSEDIDGDEVSYAVAWTADGALYPDDFPDAAGPQTTLYDDDTVPAEDAILAESWSCVVTPSDGEAEGEPAEAE